MSRYNLGDIDELCELMTRLGIALWSVFEKMYELSRTAPFDIKSTAAPQYRRLVLQKQVAERRAGDRADSPEPLTGGVGFSLADGVGRAKGVNEGDGFLFISHVGAIYPSGFLPVAAGNIRRDDLVDIYRNSELFRALRDRTRLKGKCGVCEYRDVCGGSRARAYAVTGDYLEAEPFCAHVPARYRKMVEQGRAEPVGEYFRRRMKPGLETPAGK